MSRATDNEGESQKLTVSDVQDSIRFERGRRVPRVGGSADLSSGNAHPGRSIRAATCALPSSSLPLGPRVFESPHDGSHRFVRLIIINCLLRKYILPYW
ncbi:unnamed protein product, partial [Brenthis ino]